jgi:hypothetical protein
MLLSLRDILDLSKATNLNSQKARILKFLSEDNPSFKIPVTSRQEDKLEQKKQPDFTPACCRQTFAL